MRYEAIEVHVFATDVFAALWPSVIALNRS